MTQLREDRTYRTRDGSRTGIRVKLVTHPQYREPYIWEDVSSGEGYLSDGRAWRHTKEHPGDLIEDTFTTAQPFSYASCPIVDGRRRAVTRRGDAVTLLCDDAPGEHPIVGYMPIGAMMWRADGRSYAYGHQENQLDLLVPPPPKRTLWINLAETGGYSTFNSEKEADQAATGCKRLANKAVPVEVTV